MTRHEYSSGSGIDVARESVLSFGEAARYVGKLKCTKAVAFQTLFRWATKGCRGVVLETICVGGTRCTSKEALQRFFDAMTRVRSGVPASGAQVDHGVGAPGVDLGDVDAILRRAGIVGESSEGAQ
ncbi:MAG: DUF1580 domain-containing protein [Planctomycetes bacterium]|jgi:hypothetical protein|nr:DUF1580 domain-containing protein [Planctomycetota bacterium]